jgi:tetratricopeptide (TPR) repeat protein
MGSWIGFGAHRLQPDPEATREERILRSREMLARVLNVRTLVAFLGSGCSAPLGYPTWREFAQVAVELTLRDLQERSGSAVDQRQLRRFLKFQQRLETPHQQEARELMFYLGACQKAFASRPSWDNPYHSYLRETFRLRFPEPAARHNPYRTLLELPISRFVTTNYDCEIERALSTTKEMPLAEFGLQEDGNPQPLPRRSRSFTQKPEHIDQLALFSLAGVDDAQDMVFHCHGRFDDVDSIVASEADYQRWYFDNRQEGGFAFQQTIDILFGSNAILFVGYGLGDEDLLRPLRLFSAATSALRKQFRPLFALMPEAAEGEDWDFHEYLFERYGLNVLPYTVSAAASPEERGKQLCAELLRLKDDRCSWREAWFEKPLIRKVKVDTAPPKPYRHYGLDIQRQETLGSARVERMLDRLAAEALAEARILALIGEGGTGKSWHGLKLLEKLRSEGDVFEGFFFWSSYYADDAITGLDRLVGYLDPHGDRGTSRFMRLERCIQRGRYLIVFDGVERLLRESDTQEEGDADDPGVRLFLKLFADPSCKSTLVLTSRLWPRELQEGPAIQRIRIERMRTDDLLETSTFRWFDRKEVSALCSLLEGHTYALLLAARILEQAGRAEAPERMREIQKELADAPPDRRISRMIKYAVAMVDWQSGRIGRPLLESLSVFMSPVPERTLRLCYEWVLETKGRHEVLPFAQLVELLASSRLLFTVHGAAGESEPPAFTVHPTVRSYLFGRHQADPEALPNFTLPGFTSAAAEVYPGTPENVRLVQDIYLRLHGAARRALGEGRRKEARELCRSLFGVVRSRMEANSVPRWCSYQEYIGFGIKLANLAREISPDSWRYREPHESAEIEHEDAPLYADELAWLYNDIGLTLCAEGHMSDAYAVWELGYEINRVIEGSTPVPRYTLQSQLHMAHTFLELGHLSLARHYLDTCDRTNAVVGDRDYAGRILGYRAILVYLQGDLERADSLFQEAFDNLRLRSNQRAESFFLGHRVSLEIELDPARAEISARSSRALAENGQYPDLIAYARMAAGRVHRVRGSLEQATSEYSAALQEAHRLGISRLEAEVLSELSRLALDLGDALVARQRAMEALQLANELRLGLGQTSSMMVLGLATTRTGQRNLGVRYLWHARSLSVQQEFWLRKKEIEEHLQRLGEIQDMPFTPALQPMYWP